jgi:hypothetical protein
MIVDENFFNAFINEFTSIEKFYSMRDIMSRDTRMALFKQLLTTTSVGMILPSFKEEFGDNKMVDLVGTLSVDLIGDHFEGVYSGVTIDKNGNFKISINAGAKILVELNPGKWHVTREFYFTFNLKNKIQVNETVNETTNETQKYFVLYPKQFELANFKMLAGEEE